MWLIGTTSCRLHFFINPPEKYAILSHTWGDGEVTFQDMASLDTARQKAGWTKIQRTCQLADKEGFSHVWIDTCCIDKSSSAELSESINSMFAWYRAATICYVFLSDFTYPFKQRFDNYRPKEITNSGRERISSQLQRCRWFSRGWTLQELLAPRSITFVDSKWVPFGSKYALRLELSYVTDIDTRVLVKGQISGIPVARRMSWAANRQTTRPEDMAYCLLGIFGINMPLLYGEGTKAFLRLQETIAREYADLSLFAWRPELPYGQHTTVSYRGIFATSPSDFVTCRDLRSSHQTFQSREDFDITNQGVKITVDLDEEHPVLDLKCTNRTSLSHGIGIQLQRFGDVYVRATTGLDILASPAHKGLTPPRTIYILKTLSESDAAFMASCVSRKLIVSLGALAQSISPSPTLSFRVLGDLSSVQYQSFSRDYAKSFETMKRGSLFWWFCFDFTIDHNSSVRFIVICGYQGAGSHHQAEPWFCIFDSMRHKELVDLGAQPSQTAAEARSTAERIRAILHQEYGDDVDHSLNRNLLPTAAQLFDSEHGQHELYFQTGSTTVAPGDFVDYLDICYQQLDTVHHRDQPEPFWKGAPKRWTACVSSNKMHDKPWAWVDKAEQKLASDIATLGHNSDDDLSGRLSPLEFHDGGPDQGPILDD